MLVCCCELVAVGGFYSIENPRDSYAFHTDLVCELARLSSACRATFDQCMYGLCLDATAPDVRCKKPTTILHNLPLLQDLAVCCPGKIAGHSHERVWGSILRDGRKVDKTSLSGTYPASLCASWAQAVARTRQVSEPPVSLDQLRALRARALAMTR